MWSAPRPPPKPARDSSERTGSRREGRELPVPGEEIRLQLFLVRSGGRLVHALLHARLMCRFKLLELCLLIGSE